MKKKKKSEAEKLADKFTLMTSAEQNQTIVKTWISEFRSKKPGWQENCNWLFNMYFMLRRKRKPSGMWVS